MCPRMRRDDVGDPPETMSETPPRPPPRPPRDDVGSGRSAAPVARALLCRRFASWSAPPREWPWRAAQPQGGWQSVNQPHRQGGWQSVNQPHRQGGWQSVNQPHRQGGWQSAGQLHRTRSLGLVWAVVGRRWGGDQGLIGAVVGGALGGRWNPHPMGCGPARSGECRWIPQDDPARREHESKQVIICPPRARVQAGDH